MFWGHVWHRVFFSVGLIGVVVFAKAMQTPSIVRNKRFLSTNIGLTLFWIKFAPELVSLLYIFRSFGFSGYLGGFEYSQIFILACLLLETALLLFSQVQWHRAKRPYSGVR
jgi:hypothetical protein